MSPVDRVGSLTGTNFTLGSYEKFQPGFRDEKRPKTSCGAKFEKHKIDNEYMKVIFLNCGRNNDLCDTSAALYQ